MTGRVPPGTFSLQVSRSSLGPWEGSNAVPCPSFSSSLMPPLPSSPPPPNAQHSMKQMNARMSLSRSRAGTSAPINNPYSTPMNQEDSTAASSLYSSSFNLSSFNSSIPVAETRQSAAAAAAGGTSATFSSSISAATAARGDPLYEVYDGDSGDDHVGDGLPSFSPLNYGAAGSLAFSYDENDYCAVRACNARAAAAAYRRRNTSKTLHSRTEGAGLLDEENLPVNVGLHAAAAARRAERSGLWPTRDGSFDSGRPVTPNLMVTPLRGDGPRREVEPAAEGVTQYVGNGSSPRGAAAAAASAVDATRRDVFAAWHGKNGGNFPAGTLYDPVAHDAMARRKPFEESEDEAQALEADDEEEEEDGREIGEDGRVDDDEDIFGMDDLDGS